jgi:hypothetical protein
VAEPFGRDWIIGMNAFVWNDRLAELSSIADELAKSSAIERATVEYPCWLSVKFDDATCSSEFAIGFHDECDMLLSVNQFDDEGRLLNSFDLDFEPEQAVQNANRFIERVFYNLTMTETENN